MGRAPCCDKAKVKRGPWSPDEDAVLISYVEMHGTGGNWISLPLKAGLNRCGKSCRLRWLNYLRPDIKHGGFNEQEDMIICTLYKNIGSRWSIIASHLPGRTDNDVKNYWNTKLKKKIMEEQIPLPTIQSKDNGIGDFSIPSFGPNSGYEDSHRLFMELLQTDVVESPDANGIVTGFLSPSNDSSSVASSSITMENSGGIDYVKWFAEGSSGADDLFLSELGLEPLFGECFDGNGSNM